MPAASRIGLSATIICIVVQLGLATRPLWPATASSLTPATTSGTSSCIRQKLVLSTTTAPASIHFGAHSELTLPPAEERIRSRSWMDSSVISFTSSSEPPNFTLLPAERAEASGRTSAAGNFRSARTRRMVEPTAPVAPAIPTRYERLSAICTGYGGAAPSLPGDQTGFLFAFFRHCLRFFAFALPLNFFLQCFLAAARWPVGPLGGGAGGVVPGQAVVGVGWV